MLSYMSKFKITPKFTEKDIALDINSFLKGQEKFIKQALDYIGLEFVNKARDNTVIKRLPKDFFYPHEKTGFYDHTANLRSSIGYIILDDRKQIGKYFVALKGGLDGRVRGLQVAKEIGKQYKGLKLVVVAGMDYAVIVESKGYDVITSSIPLKKEVEKIIKQFTKLT